MSGFIVRNKNGTQKSRFAVSGDPGAPVVEVDSVDQAFDLIEAAKRNCGPLVRCPSCPGGCECLPTPS